MGHVASVRSARILVVEDEASIADVVCTALRYNGHVVEHVSGGLQGLERGMEGAFDLIVLDVMLPGIDGFEICRRLREQGRVHARAVPHRTG